MSRASRVSRSRSPLTLLEARTATLTRQAQQLKDPTHLELIARECLGMVKPGEIPFVVVPRGGGAPTSGAQAAPAIDAPGGC